MKYVSLPLVSAVLALGFVWGVSTSKYPVAKPIESLYSSESPDDPDGAAQYMFNRLKNPTTGQIPKDIRKKELAFAAHLPKADNGARSLQWQNRGPYNLGGRTRALALDVTNENIILAGQVSGGMWRSTDAGQHFTQTTQPGQLHSTTCVVQDRRAGHTNTWYYGTGEEYGIVNAAGFSSQFSGDGIFKSTDGGLTWAQLPSTVSGTPQTLYTQRDFDFVWEIVTNPANTQQDEVYAAVVNGIWRSVDGGTSWTAVLGLDTTVAQISQYTDLAITPTGVLYATMSSENGHGGVYRSTDGITWAKITPPTFPNTYNRIEIGIAPSDESQVYIIAETPGTGSTGHSLWKYQYLSGDGTGAGGTWVNRTANIPHDHCMPYFGIDFKKYSSQNSYDMFIAVHPSDPNLVYLGGTNIYRSFDGFSSGAYDWVGGYRCDTAHLSNYVYPGHHPDQHKLIFLPSNTNHAYSGTDGGLMQSDDITAPTVVWRLMNNDYNTGQFYTCAIEPGNTNSEMIIGGLQDNGTYFTNTTDYTQAWPKTFYGDGSYCFITHGRGYYYLSIQQGKVYKHRVFDNGVDSGFTRIDPTGAGSNYEFIAPFIPDPSSDDRMYLAAGKVIYRNDSLSAIPITGNEYNTISQGWKVLSGTSTGQSISSPHITAMDVSEANPDRLFFGTATGNVYRIDSCRTATNSVKTNITGQFFPVGAYVSCVEVDRLNPDRVIVTFSNYGVRSIFYSTDAGQTWTDIGGNLEEFPDGTGNGPSVTWAHIYNDGTNTKYYIGSSIGLFSTDNLNGSNTVWAQEGAGTIGNVVINMITSRTYDNNIVVATHGNGIYSNKIFNPNSIIENKKDNTEVSCYPNPFNSSVTIELKGLAGKEIEAAIFDMNGRLLRRLKETNSSKLVWDGRDFSNKDCSPGAYLVRITYDGNNGALARLVKL